MGTAKVNRSIAVLASCWLLAGCVFPRTMANIALDQNQLVAMSTDRMTFLNILRAKDDRPLHFTSITRLGGNISSSFAAGTSVSAQLDGGRFASIAPNVGPAISSNPNFDLTVYDSQAFQQGILQPLEPRILNYYLRTGWRPDLLTLLTVQKIEFVASRRVELPAAADGEALVAEAGEVVASLMNSPSDPAQAARFMAFASCFTLAAARRVDAATPLRRAADVPVAGLADLARLDGSGLDIAPAGERSEPWVVRPGSRSETVGLARDHGRDGTDGGQRCTALAVELAGRSGATASARLSLSRSGAGTAVIRFGSGNAEQQVETKVDITLRSVDGVIYFLGEYARRIVDDPAPVYTIANRGALEPLLVVRRGKGSRHDLNAELNGFDYHIPRDGAGRSYEVLTLVEQLFNLNKAGQAAPLSAAVRVVN